MRLEVLCLRGSRPTNVATKEEGTENTTPIKRANTLRGQALALAASCSTARSSCNTGSGCQGALVRSPLRPKARPNSSLNLTRYGKRRKPGPQQASYPCSPGLRRSPPRAG